MLGQEVAGRWPGRAHKLPAVTTNRVEIEKERLGSAGQPGAANTRQLARQDQSSVGMKL